MDRQAWFCPGCQKHHAPHVETCPVPVDAVSDKRFGPASGLPDLSPLIPCAPLWTVGPVRPQSFGIIVKPDPRQQIQN